MISVLVTVQTGADILRNPTIVLNPKIPRALRSPPDRLARFFLPKFVFSSRKGASEHELETRLLNLNLSLNLNPSLKSKGSCPWGSGVQIMIKKKIKIKNPPVCLPFGLPGATGLGTLPTDA